MEDECHKQLHSIVVPVYESRSSLAMLVERVSKTLDSLAIPFELILVDDGSRDGSYEEIKRLSEQHHFIRGFRLSRNFGHQAALTVGLGQSRGEFIAILDDDMQDPPEMLPQFFECLYGGADVAYGVRRKRKENIVKRFFFAFFYRVLNYLSHIDIPYDSGDFCAMKRNVVACMLQMHDSMPFLRGIRSWVGFRQVGVVYERSARLIGESGYSFRKYFELAITGIVTFSTIPLHLATYIGVAVSIVSFLYALCLLFYWLFMPFDVPGYLSTILCVTLLGGLQLVTVGILGLYVGRTFDNSRNWPVAFVAEKTDGEGK
jgi:glycosyltransferase involved in cell wall biosynthesis